MRYDEFGRLTKIWDDIDSQDYPTTEFDYSWDNADAPQWTEVIHAASVQLHILEDWPQPGFFDSGAMWEALGMTG